MAEKTRDGQLDAGLFPWQWREIERREESPGNTLASIPRRHGKTRFIIALAEEGIGPSEYAEILNRKGE